MIPSSNRLWRSATTVRPTAILFLALGIGACVIAPRGLDAERDSLEREGAPYAVESQQRTPPEVLPGAGWRECLERAFAVNGTLEARYFAWRAAVERVSASGAYPNTNLAPSFSYLLSGSGMTAWDRTTLSIGFDPMQNLSLPSKVGKAAEIALDEARASGERFRAAKFALQREVLDAWYAVALLEEQVRVQSERTILARAAEGSAAERARTSGDQSGLLRGEIERRQTELALTDLQARTQAARSKLNGLMGRDATAPVQIAQALPEPRPLVPDDGALLASAVENSPDLRALGALVSGGERALELARMQYLPDINPFVSITGTAERMIGVGLSLPTQIPRIRAGIAEAQANLRGARAQLMQERVDRSTQFVGTLLMLRFSERAAQVLEDEVGPPARQLEQGIAQGYATGTAGFADMLEARRALLDLRVAVVEARIERERALAELEEIAGADLGSIEVRDGRTAAATVEVHHD